jgi:hypothetical protein
MRKARGDDIKSVNRVETRCRVRSEARDFCTSTLKAPLAKAGLSGWFGLERLVRAGPAIDLEYLLNFYQSTEIGHGTPTQDIVKRRTRKTECSSCLSPAYLVSREKLFKDIANSSDVANKPRSLNDKWTIGPAAVS